MISGILLGLTAATGQSLSYVFSRAFLNKYNHSSLHLLVLAHIIMGLFSLALLPFFLTDMIFDIRHYVFPLLGSTIFNLLGQTCLFKAFKRAEASRVSPLLGLKIFILALIGLLFRGQIFSSFQWMAVFLSIVSAFLLSQLGGKIHLGSLLWILLACFNYCFSDLSIKMLMNRFLSLGFIPRACRDPHTYRDSTPEIQLF